MRARSLVAGLIAAVTAACASHLPIEEQAPHVGFKPAGVVVISVNDQRHWLQKGKPNTFIGRAHGSFGIPTDIAVYPWYAVGREHSKQSLASALEERIVLGLARDGWAARAPRSAAPLSPEQIRAEVAESSDSRLLVLTLREWFVSLNLNRVSAFNFDWDVEIEVFQPDGSSVKHVAKGRDVVDVDPKQSYSNHIRLAYRERLGKLLDDPAVSTLLGHSAAAPGSE